MPERPGFLYADGDENGAALLQDLSVLLGRFRCKFLTYPKARNPERCGRPRLKDLNEVLQEYGQKGVVETLTRAQWLKVDGVYRMSELPLLPLMPLVPEPPWPCQVPGATSVRIDATSGA